MDDHDQLNNENRQDFKFFRACATAAAQLLLKVLQDLFLRGGHVMGSADSNRKMSQSSGSQHLPYPTLFSFSAEPKGYDYEFPRTGSRTQSAAPTPRT